MNILLYYCGECMVCEEFRKLGCMWYDTCISTVWVYWHVQIPQHRSNLSQGSGNSPDMHRNGSWLDAGIIVSTTVDLFLFVQCVWDWLCFVAWFGVSLWWRMHVYYMLYKIKNTLQTITCIVRIVEGLHEVTQVYTCTLCQHTCTWGMAMPTITMYA